MGLLSFAKSVGAAIMGATTSAPASAEELKKAAEQHGLDMSGVNVEVHGDQVSLSGTVPSQEAAEKIALAVGNSLGVQTVANNLTAAAPAPESKFYTVVHGDTLWKIAETQYGHGHGAKYTQIFDANKPMLKDPDEIYPGQVLRIPPLA